MAELKLGVVDQSPVRTGGTAAEAVAATLELAREAELLRTEVGQLDEAFHATLVRAAGNIGMLPAVNFGSVQFGRLDLELVQSAGRPTDLNTSSGGYQALRLRGRATVRGTRAGQWWRLSGTPAGDLEVLLTELTHVGENNLPEAVQAAARRLGEDCAGAAPWAVEPAVLAQAPNVRFVIRIHNADPSLLAGFRQVVEAAGAASAIEYVGELPDDHAIADLYRGADVVVSVPSSDGTPQSVLEAMACGAAPVVSDLPSLRAWVQHEGEALLTPVGDADALAEAISRLVADTELRQRIGQAALALVRQRADSAVWMAHNEAIYRRLVTSTPIQASPLGPKSGGEGS